MKYMFHRMQEFFNTFVIVLALALSGPGCGRTSPTHPVLEPPPFSVEGEFCRSLFNTQETFRTKMAPCEPFLSDEGLFSGYDIPGFPPNPGYCQDTYGDKCSGEVSALALLETCMAQMPVCPPQQMGAWLEAWRGRCLSVYNESLDEPSCAIKERSGTGIQRLVLDED